MIGEKILNYKILSKIGEGGMGVVYKALDTNLDRVVAIKVLHREFSKNKELVKRFKIEAKVQAKLIHPNICTLFALFEHNENLFMVMEYVDGVSLSDILEKKGKLSVKQALSIFIQILNGISVAHKAGIIHRDIKPSNILISKDGTVKVMDFGIAKIKGASKLTKTGMHIGTIYYMSPEQIKGGEIDFRSDIYSLGATLFETITGRPPFVGNTEFEILEGHVKTPPPIPSNFNQKIPKPVSDIVLKALSKNPEDRFKSAEEFKIAIEKLLKYPSTAQKENMAKTIVEEDSFLVPQGSESFSHTVLSFLTGKRKIVLISSISLLFLLTLILTIIFIGKKGNNNTSDTSFNEVSTTIPTSSVNNGTHSIVPSQQNQVLSPKNNTSTTQIPSKEVSSIAKDIASSLFKKNKSKAKKSFKEKNRPEKRKAEGENFTPQKTNNNPLITPPYENTSEKQGQSNEPNPSFSPNQLIEKINSCYSQGNIYSPPGDNALYYYIIAKKMVSNPDELSDIKEMLIEEVKASLDGAITNFNLKEALKIYTLAVKAFPDSPEIINYRNSIEKLKSLYDTLNGAKVFYVIHDHSGDFTRYCQGILYIKGNVLGYITINTNDGRRDNFKVHLYGIKEVKKNIWPIGGFNCFHIKLKNGKNYNFALTDKNGNLLDPSTFVDYYKSLK